MTGCGSTKDPLIVHTSRPRHLLGQSILLLVLSRDVDHSLRGVPRNVHLCKGLCETAI